MAEWEIALFSFGLALLICLPLIIATVAMTKRFKTLKVGMTYDEVINIMGEPNRVHDVGDTTICSWRVAFGRSRTVRTAYFKDGILHSVSKDNT